MITRVKGSVLSELDMTNVVSLKDLGPENTDVTTAANAALQAGQVLLVPIGTWLHKGLVVPNGGSIIGMGPRSVLKLADGANAISVAVGSNCALKDFCIDGNKVNQTGLSLTGVDLSGATQTTVVNVSVKNSKGSGFAISNGASELELINCSVTGYLDSGIKVTYGSNISIINPTIFNGDAAATGDGISLASNGNLISGVLISTPKIKDIPNRGITFIGNGARNVINSIVISPRIINPTGHGIHMLNADSNTIQGGLTSNCGGDGVRFEGDVQNCYAATHVAKNNVGYGLREIVLGSTPNNNGLIYNRSMLNGNNAITKVGAASFVV